MQFTAVEFEEAFSKAPQPLIDAASKSATSDIIFAIGKSRQLSYTSIGELASQIGYLLVGLLHPKDFVASLRDELELPEKDASEIAAEVDGKILAPVRNALRTLYTGKSEVVETSPIKEVQVKVSATPAIVEKRAPTLSTINSSTTSRQKMTPDKPSEIQPMIRPAPHPVEIPKIEVPKIPEVHFGANSITHTTTQPQVETPPTIKKPVTDLLISTKEFSQPKPAQKISDAERTKKYYTPLQHSFKTKGIELSRPMNVGEVEKPILEVMPPGQEFTKTPGITIVRSIKPPEKKPQERGLSRLEGKTSPLSSTSIARQQVQSVPREQPAQILEKSGPMNSAPLKTPGLEKRPILAPPTPKTISPPLPPLPKPSLPKTAPVPSAVETVSLVSLTPAGSPDAPNEKKNQQEKKEVKVQPKNNLADTMIYPSKGPHQDTYNNGRDPYREPIDDNI